VFLKKNNAPQKKKLSETPFFRVKGGFFVVGSPETQVKKGVRVGQKKNCGGFACTKKPSGSGAVTHAVSPEESGHE